MTLCFFPAGSLEIVILSYHFEVLEEDIMQRDF